MGFNGKLAQKALEYGFTGFGVCGTKPFDEWKKANEERNKNGHGRLIPIIHDPKEIMADAKALIVFSYPYHPFGSIPKGSVAISPYYFANAKADIAHKKLLSFMEECGYRAIDGNRLPLKAAAVRAGLGSYTKHGLVMNEDTGTYMVLKAILTNTSDFECTEKSQSICVSCDRCVTHCPTGAIMPDGHININLCLREMMRPNQKIPVQYFEKFGNCVLGCEACQLCCPYNPITSDEYTEEMAKLFSIETILSAEGERLQEVKAGF